jgi:hypothetical protein
MDERPRTKASGSVSAHCTGRRSAIYDTRQTASAPAYRLAKEVGPGFPFFSSFSPMRERCVRALCSISRRTAHSLGERDGRGVENMKGKLW